jgi:hypothetical protein
MKPATQGVTSVRNIVVSSEDPGEGWVRSERMARDSDKAAMLVIEGRSLWIPKRHCCLWSGDHYARSFAVDSAIAYLSKPKEPSDGN